MGATRRELQTAQRLVEDLLYQEAAYADRPFRVSVNEYATRLGLCEPAVRSVFERLADEPACVLEWKRGGEKWVVEP